MYKINYKEKMYSLSALAKLLKVKDTTIYYYFNKYGSFEKAIEEIEKTRNRRKWVKDMQVKHNKSYNQIMSLLHDSTQEQVEHWLEGKNIPDPEPNATTFSLSAGEVEARMDWKDMWKKLYEYSCGYSSSKLSPNERKLSFFMHNFLKKQFEQEKQKVIDIGIPIPYADYARLLTIHNNMHSRCYNPNSNNYYSYGGRGITICLDWSRTPEGRKNFVEWSIKNGYHKYLTIDRIDNDGGYSPDNCRWVTHAENNKNRPMPKPRNCKCTYQYQGKERGLKEISYLIGISHSYLYNQLVVKKTCTSIQDVIDKYTSITPRKRSCNSILKK